MQLTGQTLGVDEAVGTDRTLAGHDGTDLRACAAGEQTVRCEEFAHGLDVVIGDSLQLHGQADGQGRTAAAELLRGFRQLLHLQGGQRAVHRDDAGHERLLIPAENDAAASQGLLLFCGQL